MISRRFVSPLATRITLLRSLDPMPSMPILISADAFALSLLCFCSSIKFAELEDRKDNIKELHLATASVARPSVRFWRTATKINVLPEWDAATGLANGAKYVYSGTVYTIPELARILEGGIEHTRDVDGYSSMHVLLRVDQKVQFRHVQAVTGMLRGLRVYNVSYGCGNTGLSGEALEEWIRESQR